MAFCRIIWVIVCSNCRVRAYKAANAIRKARIKRYKTKSVPLPTPTLCANVLLMLGKSTNNSPTAKTTMKTRRLMTLLLKKNK
jgi:hypothetical protein